MITAPRIRQGLSAPVACSAVISGLEIARFEKQQSQEWNPGASQHTGTQHSQRN